MVCSHCGSETPGSLPACTTCGRTLPHALATGVGTAFSSSPRDLEVTRLGPPKPSPTSGSAAEAVVVGPPAPSPTGASAASAVPLGTLGPGTQFGQRYHIIRLLGAGGMGAVYQAWDAELGEAVAIKVIRPEAVADPRAARDLERRFKRELVLARQVTHRNVVRIHDLGEIEGIKYISMPYVQGSDLATILRRDGRVPVQRAVRIARDVAAGLQAAHEAGVVHRDLKPANIMIDDDDRPLIMDFGIARSVASGAGTMAGGVVGTLDYMAPEQAMAQPVDHRADIYALGLILYDMILGLRPGARAESAVADLMRRIQEPLPRMRTRDSSVPEALDEIVARCLEPNPAARYETTAELAADLTAFEAEGRVPTGATTRQLPGVRTSTMVRGRRAKAWPGPWIAAGIAVLLLGGVGVVVGTRVLGRRTAEQTTAVAPTSLAVLPFRNASGDSALDWLGPSIAEMVNSEIGQSPGLRIVPSDRLFQILRDLRISADTELDRAMLNRLGEYSSAELVVSGRYARFGSAIRVDASIQGRKQGTPIVLKAEASSEGEIPKAMQSLARSIQERLALAPNAASTARSAVPGPTSASIPALKAYTAGLQLVRQGNRPDALKQFQAATEADPAFAMAFTRLAQTYANLGYSADAEQAARTAANLSQKLAPEQRYLVEAIRAQIANDTKKAIEAFERLAKIVPDDSQVLFDLGTQYENAGAYDKARDAFARVLERDPKYGDALFAMGRVEMRRRNFQPALDHLNPALSVAIQADNQQLKGSVLNTIGIVYRQTDKPEEALRKYEEALEVRRGINDRRGVAASLNEKALVLRQLNRADEALANFDEALKIRREIGDTRGIAAILVNVGSFYSGRGDYTKALDSLKESLQIQLDVGDESGQALSLNNIGSVYLQQGRYDEALTNFELGLQIREKLNVAGDTAQTLHNTADTLTRIGQFERAESRYLRALELRRTAGDRRGAAISSLSIGRLFEFQGRYGAALAAREEALKTFRDLKDHQWLAEASSGYGSSLVLAGRSDQARQALDEALGLARDLKNPRITALTLNGLGDSFFYRGDFKTARPLFEQARDVASKTKAGDVELISRLNLAKLDVKEGRARTAVSRLKELARQADELRLRPVSVACTLYLGEALLAAKDVQGARRELETALNVSDKLGLRALAANAHYLLGMALRAAGDQTGASRHLGEAQQIVGALRKEAGTDELLARDDFRRIMSAAPSH